MKAIIRFTLCAGLILTLATSLTSCHNEAKADIPDGTYFSTLLQAGNQYSNEPIVYICTGPNSKRYHRSDHCKGFARCSGSVQAMTRSKAESIGRTPCKWCYK